MLGADIDFMTLHGRSRPSRITQKVRERDERVRANLEQYGCGDRYIDVIISDFSNPLWREGVEFDAIITDRKYKQIVCKSRISNYLWQFILIE